MTTMMKSFTKPNLFLLAIIAALLFTITACGNGDTNDNNGEADDLEQAEQQDDSTEADAAEDDESQEAGAREVEHAMGTTTIEGTPQRIVTLYQGATDAAVAFDVKPVGAVESWVEQPFYEYLRDDLEGVEIVGQETQPNLEEIAALNPDLIIASQLRHEEIYEHLSEIAPTVAHEDVSYFKETVELMGQAMNREEDADRILNDWEERVADFQTNAEAQLGDDWPLNVAILNFRADHARIYFTGFAGGILKELGFERPENQQSDEWGIMLSDMESIPEMNADIFYIFNEDDEAIQNTFEEWTSHPLWSNLDAVQNDQVHMVDEVTWNMGGGIIAANNMLDEIYDRLDLEQ